MSFSFGPDHLVVRLAGGHASLPRHVVREHQVHSGDCCCQLPVFCRHSLPIATTTSSRSAASLLAQLLPLSPPRPTSTAASAPSPPDAAGVPGAFAGAALARVVAVRTCSFARPRPRRAPPWLTRLVTSTPSLVPVQEDVCRCASAILQGSSQLPGNQQPGRPHGSVP